jgi:hypothetical protein
MIYFTEYKGPIDASFKSLVISSANGTPNSTNNSGNINKINSSSSSSSQQSSPKNHKISPRPTSTSNMLIKNDTKIIESSNQPTPQALNRNRTRKTITKT